MNKMITELCQLLKETTDMIAFEEVDYMMAEADAHESSER